MLHMERMVAGLHPQSAGSWGWGWWPTEKHAKCFIKRKRSGSPVDNFGMSNHMSVSPPPWMPPLMNRSMPGPHSGTGSALTHCPRAHTAITLLAPLFQWYRTSSIMPPPTSASFCGWQTPPGSEVRGQVSAPLGSKNHTLLLTSVT